MSIKDILIGLTPAQRLYRGESLLWQRSRLPVGLQEVEWIESHGKEWINTGYILTSDVVEYGAGIYGMPSTSSSLFGAESNGFYAGVPWTTQAGQRPTQLYVGTSQKAVGDVFPTGQWNTLLIKTTSATSGIFAVNENTKTFSYRGGLLKTLPLYLFCNDVRGTADQKTSVKMSYFYITDNGKKTRDYVPCYRKSDGVIGMYDTVNNAFYTNAGTGVFTRGPDT